MWLWIYTHWDFVCLLVVSGIFFITRYHSAREFEDAVKAAESAIKTADNAMDLSNDLSAKLSDSLSLCEQYKQERYMLRNLAADTARNHQVNTVVEQEVCLAIERKIRAVVIED